jgi:osmoprotectant transport system permease protein
MKRAIGPLVIGILLAALSLPSVGGGLLAWIGDPARRAVSIGRLAELGLDHLLLAGTGFALVGLFGVGLGILATRPVAYGLRGTVDTVAAIAQALPPVVVVALALPVLGFGGPPTLLAVFAYGIMPTLRGTVGAIEAVSGNARDAARALGLSRGQVLRRVELPLAGRGILDALRVALVLSVATAAVGALAGASTLGTPIVAGLQNQNTLPMIQGAAATAALAFLADAAVLVSAELVRRYSQRR